ncbi:MAG: class II aldolase/adducin family protein [Deltaproteobacteria bacterium]|nr:class II aldolase/adducin family protein [Deltaproteobacteria bacterium]
MSKRISYLKAEIAKYSLKLDHKGYVANHDGNISIRIEEGFLCTPTSEAKASITGDMILTLDHEGKKTEGIGKPFSEIKLHLAAYRARSDVRAVVHAHPPYATARGLVRQALVPRLPEAIVSLGSVIPVLAHAMPGTAESERAVEDALQGVDCFYVAGNGVLAVGADVEQAYLRLELVEHLTYIEYLAQQMGVPLKLSDVDVQALLKKRTAAGLGPGARRNPRPVNTRPHSEPPSSDLKSIIAEEIMKALKGL